MPEEKSAYERLSAEDRERFDRIRDLEELNPPVVDVAMKTDPTWFEAGLEAYLNGPRRGHDMGPWTYEVKPWATYRQSVCRRCGTLAHYSMEGWGSYEKPAHGEAMECRCGDTVHSYRFLHGHPAGLIVADEESHDLYHNQTGGYSCNQREMRGYFLPFEAGHPCLTADAEWTPWPESVEPVLRWLEAQPEFQKEFTRAWPAFAEAEEAWLPLRLKRHDGTFAEAVLTWHNSD